MSPLLRASVALVCVACSNAPASSYVGQPCGITGPTQCGGGTTCMAQGIFMTVLDAGGCTAENQACNIVCATDDDCTKAFGAGFRCETRCTEVAANQCVAR